MNVLKLSGLHDGTYAVPEIGIANAGWMVWFAHGQVQQLLIPTSLLFPLCTGEQSRIDHLVFVVHGIGRHCDLSFRTLIDCGTSTCACVCVINCCQ